MNQTTSTMAKRIAQAASAHEHRRSGRAPKSVSVVLSKDTLVITLHGILTPAEIMLAKSSAGAAQVQEFHRQLFSTASEPMRLQINQITGVEVREAAAEIEPNTGTVVQVFTTGTMVQVFLLSGDVVGDSWSGSDGDS